MSDDPYVREIGKVEWEIDDGVAGTPLSIGVDYDAVTVGYEDMTWRLSASRVEELAQLIVSATWQAAWQVAMDLGRAGTQPPAAGGPPW